MGNRSHTLVASVSLRRSQARRPDARKKAQLLAVSHKARSIPTPLLANSYRNFSSFSHLKLLPQFLLA